VVVSNLESGVQTLADTGKTSSYAGRAKTVLVFGHGDGSQAVVTTIVAQVREKGRGKRLRFIGPVTFEKKTVEHITGVAFPAAKSVLKALNLPEKYFDISAVNLDAASIMDIGLNISGFSADVPILLAILSASLQMAVPEDVVSTGHVASPDGDIRMVKNLPAKIEEAIKIKSIKRFIHPAIAPEGPLDSLSPGERQGAVDALTKAKREITTIAVHDISELARAIFSEEQVVLASLKQGFYAAPGSPSDAETASGRVVEFLVQNNGKRFWTALERQLLEGRNDAAKELFLALAQFHIQEKTYPKKIGYELLRLIKSMPPETRRLKLNFPLLPMSECIKLSQFAKESDHEDVRLLFKASFGEQTQPLPKNSTKTETPEDADAKNDKTGLQAILSEISAEKLTNSVTLPIDSARATYLMDSATVNSYQEFTEVIGSFYLHLIRHMRNVSEPIDLNAVGDEAIPLLERTFSQKGGIRAALAEARSGINGGLRVVLDLMTEQLKREQQEKHVNGVLKLAMDPLDWKAKVNLMEAFLKHIGPHLDPEIASQPPEHFAEHYENIIRAYLHSMDRLKSILRSF